MCSADPGNCIFAFVAKNPGGNDKFCHVFHMSKSRHTDEVCVWDKLRE